MAIGAHPIGAPAIGAALSQSNPAALRGRAVAPLVLHVAAHLAGRAVAPLVLAVVPPRGRATAALVLRAAARGRATAPLRMVVLPVSIHVPTNPVPRPGGVAPGAPLEPTWALVVRLGDEDVSARVVGRAEIEAVEGAARLATISYRPVSGALDLMALIGQPVTVDVVMRVEFALATLRRFTGVVDSPAFDPDSGVVTLRCTDNLQARIDAMSQSRIDTLLAGARRSDQVFDATRTGWARAQDLLSTMRASLDADARGALRVTSWRVPEGVRTITRAQYIDGTLRTRFADLTRMPPRIEIDLRYRYPRLKIRAVEMAWQYGWDEAFAWAHGARRLPADMVVDALAGCGWEVARLVWIRYPAQWVRDGIGYVRYDPALVRGFSGWATRRYVQQVEERYRVTVRNPYGPAADQDGVLHDSFALAVDVDTADWERGAGHSAPVLDYLPRYAQSDRYAVPPPGGRGETYRDLTTGTADGRAAFEAAAAALIARAARQIQDTLRASAVEFSMPIDPTIDLVGGLTVTAGSVTATGKVRAFRELYDHDAGTAITDVELAISPAPAEPADPFALGSSAPGPLPIDAGELTSMLGNYMGGLGGLGSGSAPLDAAMVGFFTNANYGPGYDPAAPRYPEHFTIEMPEISAAHRDPRVVTRVGISISAGCAGGSMMLEVV